MKNIFFKTMVTIVTIVAMTFTLATGCTNSSNADSSVLTESLVAEEASLLAAAPSGTSVPDEVSILQSDTYSEPVLESNSDSVLVEENLESSVVPEEESFVVSEEESSVVSEEESSVVSEEESSVVSEEESSVVSEEESSVVSEEESSVVLKESTEEHSTIRYGICSSASIVLLKNGAKADLQVGQQVAIIGIDDLYTIEWYGQSGRVDPAAIQMYDFGYEPNFATGQWAGCIGK